MHLRVQCFLFCLVSVSLAAGQQPVPRALITRPIDDTNPVTLRGNTHPLARAEFDRGRAPDDLPQPRMLLLLRRSPEQESVLERLLDQQQAKSSENYQKWISPEDFGARFGPSDTQIQAVTDWLTANGFQVNRIAEGRSVIEFSGTAGQVRNAFGTEIHRFSVNGTEHWANVSDPQIPAALTSSIQGVVSLNNFPRIPSSRELGMVQRSPWTGELQPAFTFTPSPNRTLYGLGPSDFATIYNVQPLWNAGIDGTGQTIAIVAESNINVNDVQSFRSLFGLPVNAPQIIVNGPDPGILSGAETEAVADVEWSGAVARNATIDLVVSAPTETTSGVDLSALYIVQNNLAPVLSMSFGDCEAALGATENAFVNELWKQAAAQGITVVVSTGDNLSAGCDSPSSLFATKGLAVNGGASTPYNVAVGGTDFDEKGSQTTYWNSTNDPATGESAKSYIPELTWNISCAEQGTSGCVNGVSNSGNAGGSGGQSAIYAKPSWQTGPGVPQDGKRDLPDVSLFAAVSGNSSFYLVCESDKDPNNAACSVSSTSPVLLGIGGTSISAQAFAGIMALVNHYQASHGHSSRQGNANYVLYQLAAQSNASCNSSTAPLVTSSCIFYDITKGNISADCFLTAPNCGGPGTTTGVLVDPSNPNTPAWAATPGFDLATGLGSVNAENLAANWSGMAFTPTATTLTVSPTTITHGQPVTVNISVAPNPGSGTPTGDVSLLANTGHSGRSAGLFTLSGGAVANQTTSSLAGGTYNLVAHYAGDGSFGGSDSSPVSVTVNPEASATLLSLVTFDPSSGRVANANASATPYGSPYILRMDVGNSAASRTNLCGQTNFLTCPTGSVNLSGDGAPLDGGLFNLNSEGFAEDLKIQLPGGVHNLQAQYSGDSGYGPSSGTSTVTITPAPTNVFGQTNGCCVLVGTAVTLTLSVSAQSSGVAPTGTVTLFDNTSQTPAATATLAPFSSPTSLPNFRTAQATAPVTLTTPGFHNFRVQYSGDQNYAASFGFSGAVDAQYKPTVTISANPQTVAYPGTTTVTAVLHSGQVSPQPNIAMVLNGVYATSPGAPTYAYITDPDGTTALQLTETFAPATSLDVSATFYGDLNYQMALSSPVHISVTGGLDFSLAASPATLSIARGQSGTTTITETELNGFTNPVNLLCSVQSGVTGMSCSVSPTSLTPAAGSNTATATVTITAAQTVAGLDKRRVTPPLVFAFVVAGLCFAWPGQRQRRGTVLVLVLLLGSTFTSISCGGGGGSSAGGGTSNPPPPPVTATITITGTTSLLNQVAVSHNTTITVTVQ